MVGFFTQMIKKWAWDGLTANCLHAASRYAFTEEVLLCSSELVMQDCDQLFAGAQSHPEAPLALVVLASLFDQHAPQLD